MKKIISSALIIFLVIIVMGCKNNINTIELPKVEDITSIEIAGGINDIICRDQNIITEFINTLASAKDTKKQSLDDVPRVDDYIRVDIVTKEGMVTVFFYQIEDKWYAERPYQGIFEVDNKILDILKK